APRVEICRLPVRSLSRFVLGEVLVEPAEADLVAEVPRLERRRLAQGLHAARVVLCFPAGPRQVGPGPVEVGSCLDGLLELPRGCRDAPGLDKAASAGVVRLGEIGRQAKALVYGSLRPPPRRLVVGPAPVADPVRLAKGGPRHVVGRIAGDGPTEHVDGV